MKKNNVFIVNDSPVITAVMQAIVDAHDDYTVVGSAKDGEQAIDYLSRASLKADMVLMDIHMPGINGVETTQRLLQKNNKLKVLITTANVDRNKSWIYQALQVGAIDFVESPGLNVPAGAQVGRKELMSAGKALLAKLNTLQHVSTATRSGDKRNKGETTLRNDFPGEMSVALMKSPDAGWLCIGASTGGPSMLVTLLKSLARPYPKAIIICQHNEKGFTESLAKWLQEETGFQCFEINKRCLPEAGKVYIAPGGYDLLAKPGGFVMPEPLNPDVNYHPNIDAFFCSASVLKNISLSGVILTGMGNDGAQGLAAMKNAGGMVYVQNKETAVIDSMPGAARKAIGESRGLSPKEIAMRLSAFKRRQYA